MYKKEELIKHLACALYTQKASFERNIKQLTFIAFIFTSLKINVHTIVH